jgi:hypothetical protein|nr:hypothetical protein [Neorhizobium tomejilense]
MRIKTLVACAALAAGISMQAAPTLAQQTSTPAASGCIAPNNAQYGRLSWFLGLSPADDLLSAWCRIQTLPGNVRFNVQFPMTNVHQSWDTSFTKRMPASRIVEIVQSMIPTDDSNRISDTGVAFGDVLSKAVQMEAAEAPDGTTLGFAPTHPASKQIVLWEPLGLRVKPVVLAGQEFTLSVYLKPNLGMFALALNGKATDVRIKAWSDRFQTGNYFRTACSAYFPSCESLKDLSIVHLPLLVETVRLDAEGDNMTEAAIAIGQELYARNASLTPTDPMSGFDRANGNGSYTLHDDQGKLDFVATGLGGTKKLQIIYTATDGQNSLRRSLIQIADDYRAGKDKNKKVLPSVPDSLGRL